MLTIGGDNRVISLTSLEKVLGNYLQDHLFVGEDFNCTSDFTLDRTGEEPHPPSSIRLRNIPTCLDPVDTWRLKHPRAQQYTYCM